MTSLSSLSSNNLMFSLTMKRISKPAYMEKGRAVSQQLILELYTVYALFVKTNFRTLEIFYHIMKYLMTQNFQWH